MMNSSDLNADEQIINKLIEDLRRRPGNSSENPDSITTAAIAKLARIGDPAIEALSKELHRVPSTDPVCEVLKKIGTDKAIETLISAFKTGHRSHAKYFLIQIGKPAVDHLISAVKHPKWKVRIRAIEALGEIGDLRAVDALIEALNDRIPWMREYAKFSLMRIGYAARKPLESALQNNKFFARRRIQSTINGILYPKPDWEKNGPADAYIIIGVTCLIIIGLPIFMLLFGLEAFIEFTRIELVILTVVLGITVIFFIFKYLFQIISLPFKWLSNYIEDQRAWKADYDERRRKKDQDFIDRMTVKCPNCSRTLGTKIELRLRLGLSEESMFTIIRHEYTCPYCHTDIIIPL